MKMNRANRLFFLLFFFFFFFFCFFFMDYRTIEYKRQKKGNSINHR